VGRGGGLLGGTWCGSRVALGSLQPGSCGDGSACGDGCGPLLGTELAEQPIGIRALAAFPRKSQRGLHSGQPGIPVIFAGVVFREGEWLCADADGVVVLPQAPPGS